jgi:hypothetical protein
MTLRALALPLLAVLFTCLASVGAHAQRNVIDLAQTKAIIADKTIMSYDRGHGTQVEFIAPNGKTYLLYPANKAIMKGDWKLERTDKPGVFSLCFRYPGNSYNPVTRSRGGNWDCQLAGFYLTGLAEIVPGDVLGLSRRAQVPFVLARSKTTIANLVRKLPR